MERLFEAASICLPPTTLQRFDHNLKDHHVTLLGPTFVFPEALRRGLTVGGHPAELLNKALALGLVDRHRESLPPLVVERQEYFDEVHRARATGGRPLVATA